MNAAVSLPSPRTRLQELRAMTPEQRRERAIAFQRAEDLRYRDLLATETARALAGQPPTFWDGHRYAPMMRAPLCLADYPVRANGGALVVRAEALPDLFGDHRFVSNGLRVARVVAADGRSWTEVSEVSR